MSKRIQLFLLATAFCACERKKENSALAAAALPQTAAAPAAAVQKSNVAYVLFTTVVKREGNDKAKVEDAKGKQVPNWVGTMYRGERLTIVNDDGGDYIAVKTSGDVAAFVKRSAVLIAPELTESTVLETTDAFERPDLLALNSKKKITPGTLVFALKTREQFSEVNAQGTGTVWVLSGRLTTDKDELAVAKILAKARSLKDSKDEKKGELISDLIGLAKNNFPAAKLVTLMETEFNDPAEPTEADKTDKPDKPVEAKD